MTFESYFADHLRLRWTRLRIYRRPGSFATDYRILRNYISRYKTSGAEAAWLCLPLQPLRNTSKFETDHFKFGTLTTEFAI